MLMTLITGAAALLAPVQQQTDTTFAVPAGARIEIENFSGAVVVRGWDRDAVRVSARHSGGDRIAIGTSGSVVRIRSEGRRGPSRTVDYQVTVPASAALRITGPFGDVSVDGAGSDVTVETVRGDVRVRGGNGTISLQSVEGEVSLERARGRISLGAVNEDIRVVDVAGDITAEAVNGDVTLMRIESSNVSASTVNGDVSYDGTIRDDGRYSLTTHNGDIMIGIPGDANATISIATFNGEVDSVLPITLTELRRGRRFSFPVGKGTARVDLESFNGTIHLRRPGEAPVRER